MGRTDTIEMTTLPKTIATLSSMLLNNNTTFFTEKGKICMESESPPKKESNSEQEEKCLCGYSRDEHPHWLSNFKNQPRTYAHLSKSECT